MRSFRLVKDSDFEYYQRQRLGAFIARTFPGGDFEPVCAWGDFNTLLFIVDDQFDQELIRDRPTCMRFVQRFLRIMEWKEKCTPEADGPIFAALSHFWTRMVAYSTVAWQRKMIHCVKRMFEALLWQFDVISRQERPAMEAYLKNRQFLGAAHLSTDSLEVTGNVYLPEDVFRHPLVSRLTELSRNAVCFANDLFSFGKEVEESEAAGNFNLVSILINTYQIGVEEAIGRAARIHDETVEEFIDLSGKVIALNPPGREYVQALEFQMRANIVWSTEETSRYPHVYAGGV